MSATLKPPADLNIPIRRTRVRRQRPCTCGMDCGVMGLCEPYRMRLAVIREEFEAETRAKSREGLQAKSPKDPQCCTPGCWHPRTPPLAYCSECLEASE